MTEKIKWKTRNIKVHGTAKPNDDGTIEFVAYINQTKVPFAMTGGAGGSKLNTRAKSIIGVVGTVMVGCLIAGGFYIKSTLDARAKNNAPAIKDMSPEERQALRNEIGAGLRDIINQEAAQGAAKAIVPGAEVKPTLDEFNPDETIERSAIASAVGAADGATKALAESSRPEPNDASELIAKPEAFNGNANVTEERYRPKKQTPPKARTTTTNQPNPVEPGSIETTGQPRRNNAGTELAKLIARIQGELDSQFFTVEPRPVIADPESSTPER